MPNLPRVLEFLSILEPVFSKPSFAVFVRLLAGWILCPARRTLTGIYPFADPKRKNCVQVYHYFFRAAAWLQSELFALWTTYLIRCLSANQKTLLLVIDDTTHKKTGRHVNGARVCRDAVRSTASEVVRCWALQYVPLCLVFHPSWGGEPLAIPLNIRLNRKNDQGVTMLDQAADMLRELGEWLPEHDFRLVADGAYASLAGRLPPRVTLISRLRADAAIYELPPPASGKRGRPRRKGARLPKPADLAKTLPASAWQLAQTCERGRLRKRLIHVRQILWASVLKKPVLLVISRDPEGREADDFFFSTDIADFPALVISDFADRWAVEDAFRNVKQYLGAEQPQSWKGVAPERAGAFSYLTYGVVWLVRINREDETHAAIQREWCKEKDCVSFLDALADVRKQLWRERIKTMSSSRFDLNKIQELLVNSLAWAV